MPEGHVLEFTRVTKRFNDVTAVSDFSARVEPGVVTAFLGPNGAGKTTTLRILLGQVRPNSGTATIGGVPFADLRTPLKTIGSVLEETVYRPRRSAARQLTIAAKANGIPLSRVDEVLALVGLDGEREGRIGSFSLGMRQRLSVAHALLGDAGTLVFDEPANGLDPEGIRWMRLLMRRLADEGRTVLVSSHVLSEVEQVADHVLVLSKGQLVLSSGIESLADPASGSVVVDAADRAALTAALAAAGFEVEVLRSGLTVRGGDAKTVGALAASAGIALSTLVQRGPTLEDVFIDLVRGGKFEPRAAIEAGAPDAGAEPVSEPAPDADAAAADEGVDVIAVESGVQADADASVTDADASVAAAAAASTEIAADSTEEADAEVDAAELDAAALDAAELDAAAEQTTEDASDEDEPAPFEPAPSEPAPSFDEILFGTGAPESTEASIFDETSDAGDVRADDEGDGSSSDDADPRSAAVSSMLAAAARAYYEDEPRTYPYGESATQGDGTEAEIGAEGEGEHADEPASSSEPEDPESAASDTEASEPEASEPENADAPATGAEGENGDHHDGEQHRNGEHHYY